MRLIELMCGFIFFVNECDVLRVILWVIEKCGEMLGFFLFGKKFDDVVGECGGVGVELV